MSLYMWHKDAQRAGLKVMKGGYGEGQIAFLLCSEPNCKNRVEKINASKLPPEAVARQFADKGWDVGRSICPFCLKQHRPKDERPFKQPEPEKKMPEPTTHKLHMQLPLNSPAKTLSVEEATAIVRPLSPDKRMKIRSLLDEHFDDASGMYIDGYSDQRIGRECEVAWQAVAKIRDSAYGEIKGDPELLKLQNDVRDIEARMSKFVADMTNDLTGIRARLAAAEARLRS